MAVDANSDTGNDREFERSLREDLSCSSGTDRPNKMNGVIDEQVKLVEEQCFPVLRLKSGK
jgi:hypothetical protein